MTNCNFCGNKNVRLVQSDYIYQHKGSYMLFENVPCEECTYCGERYYEANTLKKIEHEFLEILNKRKQPTRKIEMPVEVFSI